jgi:hypothetical protein
MAATVDPCLRLCRCEEVIHWWCNVRWQNIASALKRHPHRPHQASESGKIHKPDTADDSTRSSWSRAVYSILRKITCTLFQSRVVGTPLSSNIKFMFQVCSQLSPLKAQKEQASQTTHSLLLLSLSATMPSLTSDVCVNVYVLLSDVCVDVYILL